MSALDFYNSRFSRISDDADVSDAALQIDMAHTDVAHLLDVIIDIGEAAHFDQDHLYAACRSAMARLAEVERDLNIVSAFCAKARRQERACESDDTPTPAPAADIRGEPEGELPAAPDPLPYLDANSSAVTDALQMLRLIADTTEKAPDLDRMEQIVLLTEQVKGKLEDAQAASGWLYRWRADLGAGGGGVAGSRHSEGGLSARIARWSNGGLQGHWMQRRGHVV